jgi:hypothetical protein
MLVHKDSLSICPLGWVVSKEQAASGLFDSNRPNFDHLACHIVDMQAEPERSG